MSDDVRISARMLLSTLQGGADATPRGFRPLAGAITAAIRRGDVPAGSRLPTERSLASALGLSRGSVVAAYELLRDDGLVLRRQGSGTWVRADAGPLPGEPTAELAAALRARRLTARVIDDGDTGVIDLGLSALEGPWQLDPAWFDVDRAALLEGGRGHGYLPDGVTRLREGFAQDLASRGLAATTSQVALTHGSQHGISVATRLLVRPGDHVVVESPTFPGAIDAFARAGARITSIGTDAGGARLDELAAVLAQGDVRVVYTVPTCQSPTGTVMGSTRRRALAALIDDSSAWSIEDETLAPLHFDGPPPPPVASFARSDRHVVVGSLSKQVWGGLRVGWLWGNDLVVERLVRLRAATDLGAPVHGQLVALAALDGLEARTFELRSELERRCELLCDLVQRDLPDWVATRPDGGLSVWCRLPAPAGDALAAVAPQLGVAVLAGSSATADDRGADHVRLSFAAHPARLEVGVQRLAEAWRLTADALAAPRRNAGQPASAAVGRIRPTP